MDALQALFAQVLEITVPLSLVIAALLILRPRLGRRYRAKVCYWAWLLVALRLAIPFNPTLPQAPVQVPVKEITVLYRQQPAGDSTLPVETAPAGQNSASQSGQTGAEPSAGAERPTTQFTPAPVAYTPALTLAQLLSLVWLAGALVFLLWQLGRYARFRRRVRRWREPERDPAVQSQFADLRRRLGAPSLALARCGAVSTPLITGFFRPALLLPLENYAPEELDAIFRHELVHARRHDLWYKLLLLAAQSIHWFNPLVHGMARRAARDLEISCDEAVVTGQDAAFQARYGRAILDSVQREQSAPLTSYFRGGKGALAERLRVIAGRGGRRRGIVLVCLTAALVATLAAACSLRGEEAAVETLPGYRGETRWDLGDYQVELDTDGEGILTFYLTRQQEGETVRIPFQQLAADYGPDLPYPYADLVSVRPFDGVLEEAGFVLTYGAGAASVPVEYYVLDESGSPQLFLACDGQVYELDADADGTAELLEVRYGTDGDARLYDRLDGGVCVGDINHAAAVALGFLQGGVGVEYLEPEGDYTPGTPMAFRCFARLNDTGTPAGNAVREDAVAEVSWDDLTYTSPVSAFTHDASPLWPEDPDFMGRDSGTLWWNDAEGQGYGVDFSLHIPADVTVQDMGSGCHEYWAGGPMGGLELLDYLSTEGLEYLGDGVYTQGGLGWYEGSLDVELGSEETYRSWYYPLSDGVHWVRLRWMEGGDTDTAQRMRNTLTLSNDGPIVRTYYDYEKPTSALFGLGGEYAAIFDYLVEQRWETHQANHTLYLPRITCYGTYEQAGQTVYVCRVTENFYYDLTLESRTVTPGWGGSLMAFAINYSGDGTLADTPTVDFAMVQQDGEGSAQSVRELCGPLTELADAYLAGDGMPDPVWNEMPAGADLLRLYVQATGAPVDTVTLSYGGDSIPLADFRDGW
jgi:beta-lactamase regulating signal transducer with metallopeptidase domain